MTLSLHLDERTEPVVRMTFSQVEAVLGQALPASARRHRAWWSNERVGSHVQRNAWLDAGRSTRNVDLNAATVEFTR